jgi:hypothetical protein
LFFGSPDLDLSSRHLDDGPLAEGDTSNAGIGASIHPLKGEGEE